jgi:hypothetical protein
MLRPALTEPDASNSQPEPDRLNAKQRILLLGWQGTLAPDVPDASQDDTSAQAPFHFVADEALSRLTALAPSDLLRCGGSALPVDQLLLPLVHRCMGIAAAVAGSDGNVNPADLLRTHPRAVRWVESATKQWVTATLLFLERLHSEAERLAAWLGENRLPPIATLSPANSDLHDAGGPSIRIAFASGLAIFYKPRPVTGELLWYQLTRQTAAVDAACKIPAARVLAGNGRPVERDRYGWMESLASPAPGLIDEAEYWKRAGSLLCHAHVACLTDLHMSNIVATSEGPAVVDAECLGTPVADAAMVPADVASAAAILSQQLLATGLLPHSTSWELPDVSGLFGKAAATSQILVPSWKFPTAGSPSLTFTPSRLLEQQNRSGDSSPLVCLPHLVEGFRRAAHALIETRSALLAPGGWLEWVEKTHAARVVLRSTLDYGFRMSEVLVSAPQDSPAQSKAPVAAILDEETGSVNRLLVPGFVSPPGSRDIASGGGRILAERAFAVTAAESIRMRLSSLSANELDSSLLAALALPLL